MNVPQVKGNKYGLSLLQQRLQIVRILRHLSGKVAHRLILPHQRQLEELRKLLQAELRGKGIEKTALEP